MGGLYTSRALAICVKSIRFALAHNRIFAYSDCEIRTTWLTYMVIKVVRRVFARQLICGQVSLEHGWQTSVLYDPDNTTSITNSEQPHRRPDAHIIWWAATEGGA